LIYHTEVTTSLAKGWQILEFVSRSEEPVSVRGIAVGTGLSKSTVHRLASELEGQGSLETEPAGYRLGLQLFELGGIALRQHRLEDAARQIMEGLYDQTRRLTQLGVLLGTDVMYLARVGHQGHQRVASPVAGRIPATCTALGKALLAHNPAATEEAIRSDLVRRTRHSITQLAVLRSQLSQVRRNGYAVEYQEARIGLACVASPVMIRKSATAAISITGPSDSFDPLLSARAVRTAARRLSKVLVEGAPTSRLDNDSNHPGPPTHRR
jgi:DNA-binding IclR family transcriptional regulator